jgi:hypothetical protein
MVAIFSKMLLPVATSKPIAADCSQKKYKCTGGHSQTLRPTSLKPEYCPSVALDDVGVRSSHIISEVADTAGTCAIGGDHMF